MKIETISYEYCFATAKDGHFDELLQILKKKWT